MTLTQEEAHRLFEYRDGALFWKARPRSDFKTNGRHEEWNKRYSHKQAGSCAGKYVNVSINKIRYQVHRVIFLMQHGYISEVVDHIDGNRQNNKIENLRAATHTQNLQNAKIPKHNSSGCKNVIWHRQRKKWAVRLVLNKKSKSYGLYDDLELAQFVAQEARNLNFGQFARDF
jgi:hypothetical protein